MIGRLLATALAVLLPSVAAAHSEHGDPTSVGSQNVFAVQGYRVEVLSHPSPLTRGHPSHVVTRVLTTATPDWTPAPLAPDPVIGLLQVIVIAVFFALSLMASHRLAQRVYGEAGAASRALIPVAVLSLIFPVAGIVLLQQPMGMRHGM